jgi:hypothetical protein
MVMNLVKIFPAAELKFHLCAVSSSTLSKSTPLYMSLCNLYVSLYSIYLEGFGRLESELKLTVRAWKGGSRGSEVCLSDAI